MNFLKTELHCHNVFSNFHLDNLESPYDCNVTLEEQLQQAYKLGLDVLFITNHNTLDGYKELIEYKNNHEKYKKIRLYPGEEVSTDKGAHVLVYGISECIKPGLTLEEILDEVKKQDGISSAPHPFTLVCSIREKAKACDLLEVFNSYNVDIFSNIKAGEFAAEHGMTPVSGSDSHTVSTLGRCLNVIESENSHDDVLYAIKHHKIKIQNTGYVSEQEVFDHLKYKFDNSRDYLNDYVKKFSPNSQRLSSLLVRMYERNPDSYLWRLFYKIAIIALRRVSKKVNLKNYDPDIVRQRDIKKILIAAF